MDTKALFAPIFLALPHHASMDRHEPEFFTFGVPTEHVSSVQNIEEQESKTLSNLKYTLPIEPIHCAGINRRLSLLSFLKENWNGDGADVPTEQTFFNARRFIKKLPNDVIENLTEDDINLTPYGTIVLDFQNKAEDIISVEIGKEKIGFFTEFTTGKNIKSPGDKIGVNEIPKELIPVFEKFCRKITSSLYIQSAPSQIIPETIDREERLIRGIFYHIHFKNKKLSENAFLPKTGKHDVSVLRHDYTTDNFCKSFFATMPSSQTYKGMFVLLAKHIEDMAATFNIGDEVTLKVTPLDETGREISQRPILKNLPGTPMHSDLFYKYEFNNGDVQTKYRQFARELVRKVNRYLEDPNTSSPTWDGPDLKSVSFTEL